MLFDNYRWDWFSPKWYVYMEYNTYKNPEVSLIEIAKTILKVIWKCKRSSIVKTIWKEVWCWRNYTTWLQSSSGKTGAGVSIGI